MRVAPPRRAYREQFCRASPTSLAQRGNLSLSDTVFALEATRRAHAGNLNPLKKISSVSAAASAPITLPW